MASDATKTAPQGGVKITRREAVMGGVLLGASALAYSRMPEVSRPALDKEEFVKWIPNTVGAWSDDGSGDVVLPPPDALSDRLYDNLVTRVYRSGGEEVMMLIAYNNMQDGMLQVHRPEVCYPVGGYELTPTVRTALAMGGKDIPGSQFTATSERRTEHVSYFTRVGSQFPRTWAQQRWAVMQSNLRGDIPDGMLVRMSSLSRDGETAFATLKEFMSAFYQASDQPLQKLLIS